MAVTQLAIGCPDRLRGVGPGRPHAYSRGTPQTPTEPSVASHGVLVSCWCAHVANPAHFNTQTSLQLYCLAPSSPCFRFAPSGWTFLCRASASASDPRCS
eukprot:scaffold16978_cov71-Phaeocystis_antarctica.AAC.3